MDEKYYFADLKEIKEGDRLIYKAEKVADTGSIKVLVFAVM